MLLTFPAGSQPGSSCLGSLAPAEGDQIWFWSEGKLLTDQRGQVNALAWGLALSEGGAAIQRSGHREGPGLLARPQGCAGLASETVSGAASLHTARRRRHLGLRCCSWWFYTRSCQRVILHRECWTEHPDWNVATTASACGPLWASEARLSTKEKAGGGEG